MGGIHVGVQIRTTTTRTGRGMRLFIGYMLSPFILTLGVLLVWCIGIIYLYILPLLLIWDRLNGSGDSNTTHKPKPSPRLDTGFHDMFGSTK